MKTGFLFGAGADSVFGIGSGRNFFTPLLINGFNKERKSLLGESSDFRLIHSNSKKVFIQTINTYEKEAEKIFDKEILDMCREYNVSGFSDKVKPLFNECTKWYGFITNTYDLGKKENMIREFFLNNAVFFDTLDEKFNDLRNPELGANGKKVVNAYYIVLVQMMKYLYQIPEDFVWTIDHVVSVLQKDYDNINNNASYYSVLNESELPEYFVATSNYTYLTERITGRKDTIYLHGKMTWFEDYHKLQFYDVVNDVLPDDKSNLMPFIMIPSGIKPIICTRQLNEYSRFITELSEAEKLCVVGYRFNSEDNHINAIIGDWLREGHHQLIYFDYQENDSDAFDWDRCKWASDFSRKKIRREDILDNTEQKILTVQINRKNGLNKFGEIVEQLKQAELNKNGG